MNSRIGIVTIDRANLADHGFHADFQGLAEARTNLTIGQTLCHTR